MKSVLITSIVAAICTAVAGLLHLSLIPGQSTNSTILFLVWGIAQVFWVIPTIKRWGIGWDTAGLGGTVTFIFIWVITRIPENPIMERGGCIGDTTIILEALWMIFVILLGILIVRRKYRHEDI